MVVGAGIVGANIAYQLSKAGRPVRLIDSIAPHAGASGRSWAWINAVAADTPEYAALRLAGIEAYHRLEKDLDGRLQIDWTGSVLWDPYLFDPSIDYTDRPGIKPIDRTRLKELEPLIGPAPDAALSSSRDGFVDGAHAVDTIVEAAVSAGATLSIGHHCDSLVHDHGRVTGVRCGDSILHAETIVLSAGIGTTGLLAGLGRGFPTANRAGLLLTTKPVEKRLQRAIWTETVHVKQLRDGRLVIGEGAHEEGALDNPDHLAEGMLARTKELLPDIGKIEIDRTSVATRPIPGDGYPAIGQIPGFDGLYMAVMHSGYTLAAIAGELVTAELTGGGAMPLLAPFRPERFSTMCR